MYSFPQQQKIFKDLLSNNSSNKQCADCNTVGPTWASLNFGVFLCSNCSGAHRALGPTITRVKSTKLDQWQKDWMECMQIGNKQLNEYWQAQIGMNKKPKMGASQPELIKYAQQKYVKKRYVKNTSQQDPLTRYKNGTYVKNTTKEQIKPQQQKSAFKTIPQPIQKPIEVRSNVAVQNQPLNLNLIEFQFPQTHKLQVQSQSSQIHTKNNPYQNGLSPANVQTKQKSQYNTPQVQQGQDQFSQYTEHGTSFTGTTTENNLTYQQLVSKKSTDSGDFYHLPPQLHHTQSASSIPHYTSPHFNINMNGHVHHVGGHQVDGSYNNSLNYKQLYNQPQNPYQSVGYIPHQPTLHHPQQQYNSFNYGAQNHYGQNSLGMNQNFNLHQNSTSYQHNNNFQLNYMSNQNQANLNPSHQSLGGYHNQGYGSHTGQGAAQPIGGQKQQEFHWNDFGGWQGLGGTHTSGNQQNQQQNQSNQQQKSWVDDWK